MQHTARTHGTVGDKCGVAKDPGDWKGQDGFIGGSGTTITHCTLEKRREENRREEKRREEEDMWGESNMWGESKENEG